MWHNVFESCSAASLFPPDQILDLLLDCMPTDRRYAVVLDGLEDCPDDEVEDTLRIIDRLMQNQTVLLCYSARSESRFQHLAQQKFSGGHTLDPNDSAHNEEIKDFILSEISRRNISRHLDSELEAFLSQSTN